MERQNGNGFLQSKFRVVMEPSARPYAGEQEVLEQIKPARLSHAERTLTANQRAERRNQFLGRNNIPKKARSV